jgi:sialate O-acetylesterase
LLAAVVFDCATSQADVRLHSLFSDNMVLQQEMRIPVWGSADPGETVTVTLNSQTATAMPDAKGKWMVKLTPMKAGGPLELVASGRNTITVRNVLVGEVWVGSGQSNMH